MNGARWTAEEEEILFGLVGDLPWSVATRVYNQWAATNGYARRTARALHRRVNVAGYSIKATGTWIDVPTIAQLLGTSGECIRRWVREGQVDAYREGTKIYIKRKSLRSFARKNHDLFSAKPRDQLFLLLDDQQLAEELSQMPSGRRSGRETPIICIETGRVYSSYRAAAQAVFVSRQAITSAIRRGTPSAGYHWRRVA